MSSNNERIVRILRQAGVFFFATVDGDQPNVRPFNAVMEYEDRLYFYTNIRKNAFRQMNENPHIEVCAVISDDRWIRVRGTINWDGRVEARRAMLESNPALKKMYTEDDKIFELFYLDNVEATIHSLTNPPEVIC